MISRAMASRRGIRAYLLQAVLLAGALCLPFYGQSDVRITQTGFYRTIAFNKTWAGTGGGALTNNYIYVPSAQAVGACVSVQNNDTNSHAITITPFGSTNSNTPLPFTSNTNPWITLNGTLLNLNPVLAGGMSSMYVRTAGMAQVVISVSGTSGAGTASIFIAENSGSEAPCVGGTLNTFSSGGVGSLIQCNTASHLTLAASSTSVLIPAISGLAIHVCGFSITTASNLTNNGVTLVRGTQAVTPCDTGPLNLWGPIDLDATVGGAPYTWGGGLGVALPLTAQSEQICATSTYTVGTTDIDIFYTRLP